MPPKGRTPGIPPRRRPRVAGLHQTARPTPAPSDASPLDAPPADSATADTPAEQWADSTSTPTEQRPDEQWADDAPDPTEQRLADHRPDTTPAEPTHAEPSTNSTPVSSGHDRTTPASSSRTPSPTARTKQTERTEPAEAAAGRDRWRPAGVSLVVVLLLVALVGGAAAAFFRGQAARAETGSADNLALVHAAATGEVVGQVSKAIEIVLSYDHTKLDENERAGREVITGRYGEEFGVTFADVRRTAPEQKLVLTTTVLLAGVTTLSEDRAEVIATMDLEALRDTTPYTSPGRVKVVATKVDGRWKIAEMTLL